MRILRANTANEVAFTLLPSGTNSLMTDTMYRTLSSSMIRAVWSAPVGLADGLRGRRSWSTRTSGNGDVVPGAGPNCVSTNKREWFFYHFSNAIERYSYNIYVKGCPIDGRVWFQGQLHQDIRAKVPLSQRQGSGHVEHCAVGVRGRRKVRKRSRKSDFFKDLVNRLVSGFVQNV